MINTRHCRAKLARSRSLKGAVILLLVAVGGHCIAGDGPSFDEWLQGVRKEAMSQGISDQTLNNALVGLRPDERVLGFDRNQPEFVQTFDDYLKARVTKDRIEQGKKLYKQYRQDLMKVSKHYGVGANYLVAFWGLESSYGKYQGKYSVVRSVATLAHDPRRSAFFRNELLHALRILDEGHVTLEKFVGGWAGAMGQNQFIPTSFLKYAQDYDGDGRKDIWATRVDVWASIANYLNKNGWQSDQGWGLKVRLPRDFADQMPDLKPDNSSPGCRALNGHSRELTLGEWYTRGVDLMKGHRLPGMDQTAALIFPESSSATETYLVLPNFRVILSYNCANKYAVSVGLMADLLQWE